MIGESSSIGVKPRIGVKRKNKRSEFSLYGRGRWAGPTGPRLFSATGPAPRLPTGRMRGLIGSKLASRPVQNRLYFGTRLTPPLYYRPPRFHVVLQNGPS